MHTFQAAIDSGPMASNITGIKIPKLIAREFSVQAATSHAYANTLLIAAEARAAGIASRLFDLASRLYGENRQPRQQPAGNDLGIAGHRGPQ